MGYLVKNKDLNYWLCGLVFVIVFSVVIGILNFITAVPILGWLVYIIVMPYIAGRLVDYVSDRWMD